MPSPYVGIVSFNKDPSSETSPDGLRILQGTIPISPHQHLQMDDGTLYYFSDSDSDMDTAHNPKLWAIVSPALTNSDEHLHIHLDINLSAAALVRIYNDVTQLGSLGTELTLHNRDHNVTTIPTDLIRMYRNPTIGAGGLGVIKESIETGGAFSLAGETVPVATFNIKQNSTYLISVTVVANDTRGSILLQWHP